MPGGSKQPKNLPLAVSQAIQANRPGAKKAEIIKENGTGRVSRLTTPKYVYEAELTEGEVEVNADGTVIKAP